MVQLHNRNPAPGTDGAGTILKGEQYDSGNI